MTDRTLYDSKGRLTNPFRLRAEDCDLEEIAIRLARRYRFAAAVPYTVAEHSVAVAVACREAGHSLAIQQSALMHDAPEVWLGDIPAPLKGALGWREGGGRWRSYAHAETHAWRVIAQRYGLEWPVVAMAIDRDHCAAEARFFFRDCTAAEREELSARLDPYGLRRAARPAICAGFGGEREPVAAEIADVFLAHAITLELGQ